MQDTAKPVLEKGYSQLIPAYFQAPGERSASLYTKFNIVHAF